MRARGREAARTSSAMNCDLCLCQELTNFRDIIARLADVLEKIYGNYSAPAIDKLLNDASDAEQRIVSIIAMIRTREGFKKIQQCHSRQLK